MAKKVLPTPVPKNPAHSMHVHVMQQEGWFPAPEVFTSTGTPLVELPDRREPATKEQKNTLGALLNFYPQP